MVACFVGCMLGGKDIPDRETIFNEPKPPTAEEDEVAMKLYLEQFRDYANWHNKKRGGDNG